MDYIHSAIMQYFVAYVDISVCMYKAMYFAHTIACGYLSSTGSLMIDRFINAINLVLTVTVLT